METEAYNRRERNIDTAHNEANIINSALDAAEISRDEASNIVYEQLIPRILHSKMFVELPLERLKEMGDISQGEAFLNILSEEDESNRTVLDKLAENNVSLSIAMQEGFDEDEYMIEALKKLNERGINPTLWLVLNDKVGYWINKANVKETITKLDNVINWSRENGIDIDKIGIDYEPPIQMLKALNRGDIRGIIDLKKEYGQKTLKNENELGDIQQYMDDNLRRIMKQYDIGIETYVPAAPLRQIAKKLGLILDENEYTDRVPMTYTSASKILGSLILSRLEDSDIPALGIVGKDKNKTPGRDLKEGKPESHLTLEELTFAFNKILGRKNPFRYHNVFALDSMETLNMVLEAREKSVKEK